MADLQSELLFEMSFCIVDLDLFRLDAPTYTLPLNVCSMRAIPVLACVRSAKMTLGDLLACLRYLDVIHDLLYCATYPPSTVMVCPVTNEAASEQSQTTVSAISSGLPNRPMGSDAIM